MQYLAGFLFLWSLGMNTRDASPLTTARYVYYYGDRYSVRKRLARASAIAIAVVSLAGIVLILPRPRSLHGEAQFANSREIARAGLFTPDGIILGLHSRWWPFRDSLIVLAGQTGVALAAQPGSGKNVGVVTPNLFRWKGSAVVTDAKIENYTITAGFRLAIGQQVFLFNPLDPFGRTHRWNPLDYVSEATGQRVSDLQLIAHMFWPDPAAGGDPFWSSGGRTVFLGIGLYLFETPGSRRTIGEILRQGMATHQEGFSEHWRRVIQGRMSGQNPLSAVCVRALYDVIDLAPQTASSIRRTFTSRLELWLNPVLDAATSHSDFDLRALRKTPMTIYLGVSPKDLDRLSPLVSLFFQQAIALQTDQLPEQNPELRYSVLLVMDEFPAFGRIPILAKASGFLRGYNVRLLLIMQTLSQIRDVYGEHAAKTLIKTMGARIFFAPGQIDDATEVSSELGFTTVAVKSVSRPAFDLFGPRGHRTGSVSTSSQRRALLLPQEVKEIGTDRQIVLVDNVRPIVSKKIYYYRMPMFRRLVRPPPIVPRVPPLEPTRPSDSELPAKTRAAATKDIERMEELTLEDLAINLEKVPVPEKAEGERLSPEELNAAVEGFLEVLRAS